MVAAIRVLIVDDSLLFREFISRALSREPNIEVVGTAGDAFEAQKLTMELLPDVITLDIEMPKMRGTDFLRHIRPRYPSIQVVVVSSVSGVVFEALQAGAVDFVAKPSGQTNTDAGSFMRELVQKIKIAATASRERPPPVQAQLGHHSRPDRQIKQLRNRSVIAIGASTGGTEAILEVIKNLPQTSPGIVIVQHMPPVFTKMYADRLDKICNIKVKEGVDGERLQRGIALLAPGGERQMRLKKDASGYYIKLTSEEKISGHCPSVDALFVSVAETAGREAIGVLLTGMGADGAKGLLEMKRKGAYTIGQDEASCVVYGMPMEAYKLGAVTDQLPLGNIGDAILSRLL